MLIIISDLLMTVDIQIIMCCGVENGRVVEFFTSLFFFNFYIPCNLNLNILP